MTATVWTSAAVDALPHFPKIVGRGCEVGHGGHIAEIHLRLVKVTLDAVFVRLAIVRQV